MEKRLLEELYDRLWQAITFTPGGSQVPPFQKDTTFIQLSKGEALNPADFTNAVTPMNPMGDLKATELFSRMVDAIPAVKADYTPSTSRISTVYRQIVQGANSSVQIDTNQQKIYDLAFSFLNTKTTITDFTGKEITTNGPSHIAQAYDDNRLAYVQAASAYQSAFLNYDLNDPKQQREWQANAPILQAAINQTYNKWRREGAAQVEQAQAALDTSINSAVRNIIREAQQTMNTSSFESNLGRPDPWYLAYALPTDWADPNNGERFMDLSLKSSSLRSQSNSNFRSYGGGASWFGGLFSVGGSFSGSSGSQNFHMEADNLELSAKLFTVRIYRPWLNGLLFRTNSWFVQGFNKNGISNGKLQGNEFSALSLIPTAFVVARDVKIKANFTSQDMQHVQNSFSGSAGFGIGPFRLGGSYSYSSSSSSFKSTNDGGVIEVPGLHILAWISEIVPPCPPEMPPVVRPK